MSAQDLRLMTGAGTEPQLHSGLRIDQDFAIGNELLIHDRQPFVREGKARNVSSTTFGSCLEEEKDWAAKCVSTFCDGTLCGRHNQPEGSGCLHHSQGLGWHREIEERKEDKRKD